jgi:hypothetical protein
MKKETTYAGTIKNQGTQTVKAPFGDNASKAKPVVHKGKDLRSGK